MDIIGTFAHNSAMKHRQDTNERRRPVVIAARVERPRRETRIAAVAAAAVVTVYAVLISWLLT